MTLLKIAEELERLAAERRRAALMIEGAHIRSPSGRAAMLFLSRLYYRQAFALRTKDRFEEPTSGA